MRLFVLDTDILTLHQRGEAQVCLRLFDHAHRTT